MSFIVDAADYTVWRDTLGSTIDLRAIGDDNTGASAGVINQADYAFWKCALGNHAGGGSSSAAAVPEPATLLLISLGMLAMVAYHRVAASQSHSGLLKKSNLQAIDSPVSRVS